VLLGILSIPNISDRQLRITNSGVKYLSKHWNGANFETQIKEIAHNIRNTKSNQTVKQKKIYQPQQINLLSCYGL
jgi:hypothetical protein